MAPGALTGAPTLPPTASPLPTTPAPTVSPTLAPTVPPTPAPTTRPRSHRRRSHPAVPQLHRRRRHRRRCPGRCATVDRDRGSCLSHTGLTDARRRGRLRERRRPLATIASACKGARVRADRRRPPPSDCPTRRTRTTGSGPTGARSRTRTGLGTTRFGATRLRVLVQRRGVAPSRHERRQRLSLQPSRPWPTNSCVVVDEGLNDTSIGATGQTPTSPTTAAPAADTATCTGLREL